MLSKVFFIGEKSITARRSNARRKTNRSVAAGILPAVSGGILPPDQNRTHGMPSLPNPEPPGWKPGDTAARDGCRYGENARLHDFC
jgi:hypothetical protein